MWLYYPYSFFEILLKALGLPYHLEQVIKQTLYFTINTLYLLYIVYIHAYGIYSLVSVTKQSNIISYFRKKTHKINTF